MILGALPLVGAEDSDLVTEDVVDARSKALSAVDAESAEWKAELAMRSGWWSLQPSKDRACVPTFEANLALVTKPT